MVELCFKAFRHTPPAPPKVCSRRSMRWWINYVPERPRPNGSAACIPTTCAT